MTIFAEKFKKNVIPAMQKEWGFKNVHAVPQITKVIINAGIGKVMTTNPSNSKDYLERVQRALIAIAGQKPSIRNAKQSISSFKLREGTPVGLMITLRGTRKEDFIERFVNISLPRMRDFWGIPLKNFDERGNLNYGIKEHNIFPEVSQEVSGKPFGLEISFITNASKREQAISLFKLLGFPLKKE